jgi:uncharacterized protein
VRRWLLLISLLAPGFAGAGTPPPLLPVDTPRISLIIDDLGNQWHEGRAIIQLPGEVTVSIMPYTPFAVRLAHLAHREHKEIMLHLPMESVDERFLGKGGLNEKMDLAQFDHSLYQSLDAVPDISGVNNHMGSRLTQDATRMSWLMAGLMHHGELYFVDSRTTRLSKANAVAREYGLEHARRDVFLDDVRTQPEISKQWKHLLALAGRRGSAIAIGHPYPETIKFLQQALPQLKQRGIRLIPVSKLIQWRQTRRRLAWQTQPSSSPSPRAVKNSKPSPSSTCCAAPASTSSAPDLMSAR